MSDKDSKTQAPTDKKLADARDKGDVPTAAELRHAIMFTAALIVIGGFGAMTLGRMTPLFLRLWGRTDEFSLEPGTAHGFVTGVFGGVATAMLPIMALLFVFAMATVFAQGMPSLALSRLSIKWSKLSPVEGFGRVFGMRAVIDFGKVLVKLAAVIGVAAVVVVPKAVGMAQLMGSDPGDIGHTAVAIVAMMIKAVLILVVALALFDFVYQRFSYMQRMRMSLQEVKDEHRQSEADPAIKARIRAIGMQRARRRMIAAVPTASVIITNPTHYAIALKYDHGGMAAPVVVAKGMDTVALKIREVAAAANVPIVESPALARAIYATVDIDRPIPTEHYAAVAEIIGYILRLARQR